MIVNGTNKHVTEMLEETKDDQIDFIGEGTRKLVTEARPNQTSIPTTSSSTTTLPHHLRVHHTVNWCHFRVAQTEGLQFYQTRSNAMILYNTLPAMCVEKVVVMKSGEELYSKTYQAPVAPQRVVVETNLNYERHDTTSSDARKSFRSI